MKTRLSQRQVLKMGERSKAEELKMLKEKEKERLKGLYLLQIEDYCNILFREPYPSGISLALENLVEMDPLKFNVASEKIADMSITYSGSASGTGSTSGLPDFILEWINPYRRPFIMSDKKKKYYDDGRR